MLHMNRACDFLQNETIDIEMANRGSHLENENLSPQQLSNQPYQQMASPWRLISEQAAVQQGAMTTSAIEESNNEVSPQTIFCNAAVLTCLLADTNMTST